MSIELIPLFPIVVLRKKFEGTFTKKQMIILTKSKQRSNMSNKSSVDTYILESPELANLKEFCTVGLQDYFTHVYSTPHNSSTTPYITQSWLNWTDNNESHHKHMHPNSILSGVFYISSLPEDAIQFVDNSKSKTFQFEEPTEWTVFNSGSWSVPAEELTLVIFPSYLQHLVDKRVGDKTRISLSFNSFIKGTLGSEKSLTKLIL